MPKATANAVEPERHELKTLPEGFVIVKRLTYGQKLERRAMSSVDAEAGRGKTLKMQMQLMNRQATLYDFQRCIVDHNLEDDDGNKLNLASPIDIDKLDPRVGEEIEKIMDKINNFEEGEDEPGN
jgi:hypothetical protein